MMRIGTTAIQKGSCFIIAEAGVNHNGSLALAKKLVDAAKAAKVDAVKFQTFTADEIVTKDAATAEYQKTAGEGEHQYAMLKRLEISHDEFRELKAYCDAVGVLFLSTPHTEGSLGIVDELAPAFKIGSGDLTNTPFLERIAKLGKPTIISTGMATLDDVRLAVDAFTKHNKQLIILQCTTNYPCPLDQVNLNAMETLRTFGYPVGYSDHTEGIDVSILAASRGALIIEKHFTLDRTMEGPDHAASLEPDELASMVEAIRRHETRNIPQALGSAMKTPTPGERAVALVARKSIITKRAIARGERIGADAIVIKRPGSGIPPYRLHDVIGKHAARALRQEEVIAWDDLA